MSKAPARYGFKQHAVRSLILALAIVGTDFSPAFAFVCLEKLPAKSVLGGKKYDVGPAVVELGPKEANGGQLIRAREGLFKYFKGEVVEYPSAGRRLHPFRSLTSTIPHGMFVSFIDTDLSDAGRLIGIDQSLSWLKNGKLSKVWAEEPTGTIYRVYSPAADGRRLVAAEEGLFSLAGNRISPISPEVKTGKILDISEPNSDGSRLLAASEGLFRLEDDKLVPVLKLNDFGINFITVGSADFDGTRLLGTSAGLYRLYGDKLLEIKSSILTGSIGAISPPKSDGSRLIGASQGLFRAVKNQLQLIWISDFFAGTTVSSIGPEETDGSHLYGTTIGLFKLVGDKPEPIPMVIPTGPINDIGPLESDGSRLIGADNGLFRLLPEQLPRLISAPEQINTLSGEKREMSWYLESPCAIAYPKVGTFRVKVQGKTIPAELIERQSLRRNSVEVRASIQIVGNDGETIEPTLAVLTSPAAGWREIPSSKAEIRVNWGVGEYAKDIVKNYSLWVFVAHTLIFLLLVIAARWSGFAWRILTDRFWDRFGLWWWFVLGHFPMAQRWVFARWFKAMQMRVEPVEYMPMSLQNTEGESMVSGDLLSVLSGSRRIWIQGSSGMGKTALVGAMTVNYFGDTALSAAWSKYHFIVIPIALRRFSDIPVPPSAPEDWVFDIVSRTLESADLAIRDKTLLRKILDTGCFALLLDGLNEVDDKGAIAQFAQRHWRVGLLVTSQNPPPDISAQIFEQWKLPSTLADAMKPLLMLYLGQKRGEEVFAAISNSPIRQDICSGYDIRLVADLVESGLTSDDLPSDRIGLYDAMLRQVSIRHPDYDTAGLCRVAWEAWVTGRRDLFPSQDIRRTLMAPLGETGIRITVTKDGNTLSFRHDQMRGYLAARWAALHEVDPISLFKSEPQIWRVDKSDQEVMWSFFAELVPPRVGAKLLEWARNSAERAELQVALNQVAKRGNWPQF